jgi:hypothetical protein
MKVNRETLSIIGIALLVLGFTMRGSSYEGFQGNTPPAAPMPPAMPMPPAAPMPPAMPMPPAAPMPPPSASSMPMPPPTTISSQRRPELIMISEQLKVLGQQVTAGIDNISSQLMEVSNTTASTRNEGFQSGGNPYNMVSPSMQQAYEFRLGKPAIISSVLGFMKV